MESAIIVMIALSPQVEAEAFETYFRKSVQKIRAEKKVSDDVTFSVFRSIEAEQEFVWITGFRKEELQRVSRADWPFLVLAVLEMLRDIHHRFAANVSVVSSPVLTGEGLVDQWNERHGRFKKMSLDDT
jgi:hypothetical protein